MGFRRTMAQLVPVKDKTAALFHALNGLANLDEPKAGAYARSLLSST
jgi:hypothetical protein